MRNRKTCGLDIIDTVEKEFGYVKPDGSIEHFDWRRSTHASIATDWLSRIENNALKYFMSGDRADDLNVYAYMQLTKTVRLSIWQKGINVQFISLTYQQLEVIRQKVKENVTIESGRFDFDIVNSAGYIEFHGTNLRQLQLIVFERNLITNCGS